MFAEQHRRTGIYVVVIIGVLGCSAAAAWIWLQTKHSHSEGQQPSFSEHSNLDYADPNVHPARIRLRDGTIVQFRCRLDARPRDSHSMISLEAVLKHGETCNLIPLQSHRNYGSAPSDFILVESRPYVIGVMYRDHNTVLFREISITYDIHGAPVIRRRIADGVGLVGIVGNPLYEANIRVHSLTCNRGVWQFEVDIDADTLLIRRAAQNNWVVDTAIE